MHRVTRRRFLGLLGAGAYLVGTNACSANSFQPTETNHMWDEAFGYSLDRVRCNLTQLTSFPEFTRDACWQCVDDGGWVGGHWVGLLWLAFAHTRDAIFEDAARAWACRLAPRQSDRTTHDLGFLFELSHVLGTSLTGDPDLAQVALAAAKTLSSRFDERSQVFFAWDSQPGRAIIDTMMNLNLLYWAGRRTGQASFAQQATTHARTALAYLVRRDWSTAHVADFDTTTGAFLRQATQQGLSPTSCWSRGQSWAVYGFANCYGATGDSAFLTAARHLAEYALGRLPPDHVPYWDYDSPLIPNDVRDSSAAAILAAGLLRLANVDPETGESRRWRDAAITILESLWQNYSSRGTREPSILMHGTRTKPGGWVDHGLIYGDYYFLEALLQARGDLP